MPSLVPLSDSAQLNAKKRGEASTTADLPADHPLRRLAYAGQHDLSEAQLLHRQKVLDRIRYDGAGRWLWTGQAKIARGNRYPQLAHSFGGGMTQLVNARHVVFYLATGWVHGDVQQYRCRDGEPLNVHPDNIVPMPPVHQARSTSHFWDSERLRGYYG